MRSGEDTRKTKKATSALGEMFGDFCLELFAAKKDVENDRANIDFKAIHKSMKALLKASLESEKNLSFEGSAREVVYVMAALADEIFLNMDWSGKKYWEENMTESFFFGTQIAGEEVFNRINDLMIEKDPLSAEKAEIYLKALSLGFKGKYREADDERIGIDSYRNNLFKLIAKNDKSAVLTGYRLFQKEYTRVIPTIHRALLPDGAIISYICAFFIFMFLVISSVVWAFETRDLRQLLSEIDKIALRG
ncbi:MAG: DotU family type IV/VI secretion system protein [Holosporaceae bacterium]|jgi:type VI secretion system protein ImpK|nr:DotU family type IV/VI secretion system protein [Holosporaceae bacterium]